MDEREEQLLKVLSSQESMSLLSFEEEIRDKSGRLTSLIFSHRRSGGKILVLFLFSESTFGGVTSEWRCTQNKKTSFGTFPPPGCGVSETD